VILLGKTIGTYRKDGANRGAPTFTAIGSAAKRYLYYIILKDFFWVLAEPDKQLDQW
jgi:membrane peptidoglycan carboxypeptidase